MALESFDGGGPPRGRVLACPRACIIGFWGMQLLIWQFDGKNCAWDS